MIEVVLDTNILVAAMRSKRGTSYQLLSQIGSGLWRANLTAAIALEYEAVLKRNCGEFALTEEDIDDALDAIISTSRLHRQHFVWRPVAADPDDDLVLEAAIASRSHLLITFNKRHFPKSTQFGIECLTPGEFLIILEELK